MTDDEGFRKAAATGTTDSGDPPDEPKRKGLLGGVASKVGEAASKLGSKVVDSISNIGTSDTTRGLGAAGPRPDTAPSQVLPKEVQKEATPEPPPAQNGTAPRQEPPGPVDDRSEDTSDQPPQPTDDKLGDTGSGDGDGGASGQTGPEQTPKGPDQHMRQEFSVQEADLQGKQGTHSVEQSRLAGLTPEEADREADRMAREARADRTDRTLNALIPTLGGIGAVVGGAGNAFDLTRKMVRGFVNGNVGIGSQMLAESLGDVDTLSRSMDNLSRQYGIAVEADKRIVGNTLKGRMMAARTQCIKQGMASVHLDMERQLGQLGKDVDNLSVEDVAQVASVLGERIEAHRAVLESPTATRREKEVAQGYLDYAQDIMGQLEKRNSEIGKLARRGAAERNKAVTDQRRIRSTATRHARALRRDQLMSSPYGGILGEVFPNTDSMQFLMIEGERGSIPLPLSPSALTTLTRQLDVRRVAGLLSPEEDAMAQELGRYAQAMSGFYNRNSQARSAASRFNVDTGVRGNNVEADRRNAQQRMVQMFSQYGIDPRTDLAEAMRNRTPGMLDDPLEDLMNDPDFMEAYRDYRAHDVQARMNALYTRMDNNMQALGMSRGDVEGVRNMLTQMQMDEWAKSSALDRYDPDVYSAMDGALSYYQTMFSGAATGPVRAMNSEIDRLERATDVNDEEAQMKLDTLKAYRDILTNPCPGSDWEQAAFDYTEALRAQNVDVSQMQRRWNERERDMRKQRHDDEMNARREAARQEAMVMGTLSDKDRAAEMDRASAVMEGTINRLMGKRGIQGVDPKALMEMPMSEIKARYPDAYRSLIQSPGYKKAKQRYSILSNQARLKDSTKTVDSLATRGLMSREQAEAWKTTLRRDMGMENTTRLNNPTANMMDFETDFTRACDYLEYISGDEIADARRDLADRRRALTDEVGEDNITSDELNAFDAMEEALRPLSQANITSDSIRDQRRAIASAQAAMDQQENIRAEEEIRRMFGADAMLGQSARARARARSEALTDYNAAVRPILERYFSEDQLDGMMYSGDLSGLIDGLSDRRQQELRAELSAQPQANAAFQRYMGTHMTDEYVKLLSKVGRKVSMEDMRTLHDNLKNALASSLGAIRDDPMLWYTDMEFNTVLESYNTVMDNNTRKGIVSALKERVESGHGPDVDIKTGMSNSQMLSMLEDPEWPEPREIMAAAELMGKLSGLRATRGTKGTADKDNYNYNYNNNYNNTPLPQPPPGFGPNPYPGPERGRPKNERDLDKMYPEWTNTFGEDGAKKIYSDLKTINNRIRQMDSPSMIINEFNTMTRYAKLGRTKEEGEVLRVEAGLLLDKYRRLKGDIKNTQFLKEYNEFLDAWLNSFK